jgi:hypothetical protein
MEDATTSKPLVSVGEAAYIAGKSESVAHRLATGTLPSLRLLVRRGMWEAWHDGEDIAALLTDGRSA